MDFLIEIIYQKMVSVLPETIFIIEYGLKPIYYCTINFLVTLLVPFLN